MLTSSSEIPLDLPVAKPALILASASPRRYELMARLWGKDRFDVRASNFDEEAAIRKLRGKRPTAIVQQLAAGKAKSIDDPPSQCLILAADTMVFLHREMLGKPADANDAVRILTRLSGNVHRVITGLALMACSGERRHIWTACEQTRVRFCDLTPKQIQWYVGTEEPLDKAGAYGIQGFGSLFVESIQGCYFNVMGLPVNKLVTLLQQAALSSSGTGFDFISGFIPWD